MTLRTILINFDTKEEMEDFEKNAKYGCLWEHNKDELWTEWDISSCTAKDVYELLKEKEE